jgi:hypothetical protein
MGHPQSLRVIHSMTKSNTPTQLLIMLVYNALGVLSCDILLHTVKVWMNSIASRFYSATYILQLMKNVQIWYNVI